MAKWGAAATDSVVAVVPRQEGRRGGGSDGEWCGGGGCGRKRPNLVAGGEAAAPDCVFVLRQLHMCGIFATQRGVF